MEGFSIRHIIGFLESDGWSLQTSNEKYGFYSPPDKLGFPEDYTIPIIIPNQEGELYYEDVLERTLTTISKIYDEDIYRLVFKVENYVDSLRKNAIYFKLESTDIVFDKTLELGDIWSFLRNVSSSYMNYLKVKLRSDFFGNDVQEKHLNFFNENLSLLQKYSKLRLIDLKFQSFSFGVSSDFLMGNEKIKAIENPAKWRSQILPLYDNEVIQRDLTNRTDLDGLIERFNDDDRREIFQPLIRSLKSNKFDVYQTDNTFSTKTRVRKPAPSTIDLIVPPKRVAQEKGNISMYQILVPIDKSKSQLTIKTDSIDNDLFSKKSDTINWELYEMSYGEKELKFKLPLIISITYLDDESEYHVLFDQLDVDIIVKEFDDIGNQLYSQLFSNYLTYRDVLSKEADVALTTEELRIKEFFTTNLIEENS